MKKMFLALAAASLVSTMAFAQDDYDYGDDYGTEASTSSDDGYTDMDSGDKAAAEEKPASDVEYKNMDEGKKVSRNEGEMSPSLTARTTSVQGFPWVLPTSTTPRRQLIPKLVSKKMP